MVMCIRKTLGDPERVWQKGPSYKENMSEQGPWQNLPLSRTWLPGNHQAWAVILPAEGREKTTCLLLLGSRLRTPMEFKPYLVALGGNSMIIIATNYSALSVCLEGT